MDADTERPQRSAEPLWLWCSPDDIANLERLGSIRLYRDLYAQSGDVAFVVMSPGAYDEMNRQPSPREVAAEVGWLIETKDAAGRPRWWGDWNDDGLCDWTYDSLRAIRFCRKEDAERAIAMAEWVDVMREKCIATEHSWSDPSRPPALSQASNQRDIVERLLQPMSNDPSAVQRERYLAAQEITRLQRFVDGTIARAAEKAKQAQPQERDIEEIAEAISRYESDMLGAYMWEALDEQERGYYLDMVRAVFAACPRLRAQPSPREVALPLEPTAEMLSAGGAVYDHPNVYMGGPSARGRRLAGRAYKAMIEAALHGREDQP